MNLNTKVLALLLLTIGKAPGDSTSPPPPANFVPPPPGWFEGKSG